MTQEEKAKRYDEAVKEASIAYKDEDKHLKATLERIFPELKESEDELSWLTRYIEEDVYSLSMDIRDDEDRIKLKNLKKSLAWLENLKDEKDKLIKELGWYKVKYIQETLEKYVNSMSNKDDERLRKTIIAFLKDFAEQGYENAVECIDWLEKQDIFIKKDINEIFPELKESDDERIRKELTDYLKSAAGGFLDTAIQCKTFGKWVTWLKKQGEHSIYNVPSRNVILAIWDLGNKWKELTNGCISTEYGTQLDYIQKHWEESEYYLRKVNLHLK